jgi:radical SAM superfamily enzyme
MAKILSALPIDFLKIHHLQILRDTPLAKQDCGFFKLSDYIKALAIFLSYLNPDTVIQRLFSEASPKVLLAPDWGEQANRIRDMLGNYMAKQHLYQGKNYVA